MAAILARLDSFVEGDKGTLPAVFAFLEAKTGVKRNYLFYGFIGILAIYLIFGYAAQLLANFIGFGYPAYASMHAIESPQKGDDTKWLTYWTVFAFLTIVEFPTNVLLSWVPFYWLAKCIIMMWLFWPTSNGAVYVYEKVLKKLFYTYSQNVDNVLQKFTEEASKKLLDAAAKSGVNLKKE